MNKAEYKFHRDRKQQIQNQSKQSEEAQYFFKSAANSPIFIPNRKKKK